MDVILYSTEHGVAITAPSIRTMAALTSGGLGELPGDAVTDDLTDRHARVEAARSMPVDRAIRNMVADGFDADFSSRWVRGLVNGGETTATAMGLIRDRDCRGGRGHALVTSSVLPNRAFRDAWVQIGDGVDIDIDKARVIFSKRLIFSKARATKALAEDIDVALLTGRERGPLEQAYEALVSIDLRKLGVRIMTAKTPDALLALWPGDVPAI